MAAMSYHYPSHGDKNLVLERCLRDILSLIKPSETDRTRRLNTIRELATYVGSLERLEGYFFFFFSFFLFFYFLLLLFLFFFEERKLGR